jgi:hypothetical protein
MEFQKGVLDEVFCGFPLANQAVGIPEQRRFLRVEYLPE